MITPNYDKLAPWYSFLEKISFGDELQKCRTLNLNHAKEAKNILILGDGNGRFLESLLNINPVGKIDCIDISIKMMAQAKNRIKSKPGVKNVKFIHANIFDRKLEIGFYDLVVVNFFLDCFTFSELNSLICNIYHGLSPGGFLINGDFNIPDTLFKKISARFILMGMYVFFKIFTRLSASKLIDPEPILKSNGLVLKNKSEIFGSFLKSTLWLKPIV